MQRVLTCFWSWPTLDLISLKISQPWSLFWMLPLSLRFFRYGMHKLERRTSSVRFMKSYVHHWWSIGLYKTKLNPLIKEITILNNYNSHELLAMNFNPFSSSNFEKKMDQFSGKYFFFSGYLMPISNLLFIFKNYFVGSLPKTYA